MRREHTVLSVHKALDLAHTVLPRIRTNSSLGLVHVSSWPESFWMETTSGAMHLTGEKEKPDGFPDSVIFLKL